MSALKNFVSSTGIRAFGRLTSSFDRMFLNDQIPVAQRTSHANWRKLVGQLGNKRGLRVLEVGSREVTGEIGSARSQFTEAEYVGFDYYAGKNVDVIGDAHKLSSYFKSGEQFDLIYTAACFEHFAMPWLISQEIAKLLKVGGHVFVETHFSFIAHERPWNFFQFSDMGLRVLFPEALGFECIEAGLSNPIVGRFSRLADKDLRFGAVRGLYCHSSYLGKKTRHVSDFNWADLDLSEVVFGTKYPAPKP